MRWPTIFPEREMAVRVAHSLVMPNVIDYIEVSREFSIVELPAPEAFVGRTLKQLELRPRFGLTLIAIKRRPEAGAPQVTNIAPSADELIREGDVLALLGNTERLTQLDTNAEALMPELHAEPYLHRWQTGCTFGVRSNHEYG